jgi:hypothetical protein
MVSKAEPKPQAIIAVREITCQSFAGELLGDASDRLTDCVHVRAQILAVRTGLGEGTGGQELVGNA